jgi:hypothetical protein
MSNKIKWKKLCDLGGEIEAELVLGLLKTNGIPAQKIYPGITQTMKVYMGTTLGVEIYIPEADLELAKKLLEELNV